MVLLGGQLFDGRQWHSSGVVAVQGDRIAGVGGVEDTDDLRRLVGDTADVVDLQGGLLLPGFHDAHMHPMLGGLERVRCELYDLGTVEEYLDALGKHAEAMPHHDWIRGGGWTVDAFGPQGPTAELLDRALPDRPAFVMSSDHHNAWVNSAALERAGVDEKTPDPWDGCIERDSRGRPTGTLREAAISLVGDHVTTSREEYAGALAEAQEFLHGWGVTGWHDALIGGYAGIDDPTQAYLDLIDAGRLTARVSASQWWDRNRGTEQIEDLARERDRLRSAGLNTRSVKVMMDGIAETFTASMGSDYQDPPNCPCGSAGLAFLSADQAAEAVAALDRAGFQIHFHAIGDRAVHDALDAVEGARRRNGMNDLRHQIAHLQLVRPEDRRRFSYLGVSANLQGMWVRSDSAAVRLLEPHIDPEVSGWHYPFADIVAAGADVAGGSDWPVNPPEPVQAVHALVNRDWFDPTGATDSSLVADQALPLEVAMAAYTSGSAWVNHQAGVGRLQVGSLADLAVLDRDPFQGPSEQIGASEVVMTIANGVPVYQR